MTTHKPAVEDFINSATDAPTVVQLVERLLRDAAAELDRVGADRLHRASRRAELAEKLKALGIPHADAQRMLSAAFNKDTTESGEPERFAIEKVVLCAEPVIGSAILESLARLFSRFVALPDGADVVIALWVMYSYVFDLFDHAPYLAITSPTKRSGKTTTQTIISALVQRGLSAESVTPAVLFRVIEQHQPTLILDEVDRVPHDSDIWQILNSGHNRNGRVLRLVGDDHEPKAFSTFCPKSLAYIRSSRSNVSDTVEDRSIRIVLQRQTRIERRPKLRTRELEAVAEPLRGQLAHWAYEMRTAGDKPPEAPSELDDRAADSWEPLLAVAEACGSQWLEVARRLAVQLSCDRAAEEADDKGVLLLRDLGDLLADGRLRPDPVAGGFAGSEIVSVLQQLDDRPWRHWTKSGNPLSETWLAKLLKPFGAEPAQAGPRTKRVKRYPEDKLRSAIERYAEASGAEEGGERVQNRETTRSPAHRPKTDPVSDSPQRGEGVSDLNPLTGGSERGTDPLTEEDNANPATIPTRGEIQVEINETDLPESIKTCVIRSVTYEIGDTLPDGRIVETIDFGIPTLRKPRSVPPPEERL